VLPVRIVEGRQFLVGTLAINGEAALKEDAISAALGLESGAVYLPGVAQRGADRVAELYRREAFPAAVVSLNASVDPVTASATIQVTINEGPRHVLADMAVAGDTITAPALFRRVTDLPMQQPLSTRAVEDAQTRLYDTGIFRSVTPKVEPIGEAVSSGSQPVRVTFEVEEQPRYRLRYGLQATTNALSGEGFTSTRDVTPGASVDLRRNNLFGRGFFTGVGAAVTTDSHRERFLVGSSTWFGHEAETTFSLERRYARQREPYDVTAESLIASGEQRWPLTRRTRLAAGYAFESTTRTLTLTDPISGLPLQAGGTTELGSVSTTYAWDTRDNVFNPTRGLFHSSRLEYGDRVLGSDLRYVKVLVQQYGFVKRGGIVFATAARFGAVRLGDETAIVSPTVRFRAGGATTIRGFRQDALSQGLVSDGFPEGGNAMLILNQEVRVPIWGWLGGVAFADVGNTFPRLSGLDLGDLAVGLGGGLRLNSPFGIIRLDVGFPVRPPAPLRRAVWHFGFGHAF
jgi:outer membrane protein insertion porin family